MDLLERYGPWAMVTGASSGIGCAFAKELARLGFRLVLIGRNLDSLESASESFGGPEIRFVVADLGLFEDVRRVAAEVEDLDLGLFVGSAGFGSSGPFESLDLGNELDMIDVNCRALVELTYEMGGRMVKRGRGGVVLLSSLLGFQGVPGMTTYSATKAFVQSFAEALHQEWKPKGVDVLSAAPGPVSTPFSGRASLRYERSVTAEDVARETLKALGRKSTISPGPFSKFLSLGLAVLPRRMRVVFLQRVIGGMSVSIAQKGWNDS